ncbi:MAG: VWA domain-containing protein [Chlorobi bacterium]|nr:VWA domain-containing protein [Chlorobiota bacterium]MBX7216014.1 VWA domain-containing protein [Candidatus Kapabacteria bacterium]
MLHSLYSLPFSAFLGYGMARRALLCTLVDPTLCGVVISGPVGVGKSQLLSSFSQFVLAQIDPQMPVARLPLGITHDRLIGGIDFDATIAHGTPVLQPGILPAANGGILIVDNLPLLDPATAATIGQALDSGMVNCQREGFGQFFPARFSLLATAVPSERPIQQALADKIPFLIAQERRLPAEHVGRLLRLRQEFAASPQQTTQRYSGHEQRIAEQVLNARLSWPRVRVGDLAIEQLIEAAAALQVAGQRGLIFAAKAARAHAALRQSMVVEEADVSFAIATVLAPRTQNIPDPTQPGPQQPEAEEPPIQQSGTAPTSEAAASETEAEGEGEQAEGRQDEQPTEEASTIGESQTGAEQLFDPIDFTAPIPPLLAFFQQALGLESGKRGTRKQVLRGRHVRTTEGELAGRRIDLLSTLRAAAPHQQSRRSGDGDWIRIRKGDLRIKEFSERAGTLFIFCVDSSGSMATNRIREAKGVAGRILQTAYISRDRVAMIGFRGSQAELLLPPTSSVERAKRSLDRMPTGGGTPLGSSLVMALSIAERERIRGNEQALVVILTDGRANVPLEPGSAAMIREVRRKTVQEEMQKIGEAYRRAGVRSVVIDTRERFSQNSDAVRLAEQLGGEYFFLPALPPPAQLPPR